MIVIRQDESKKIRERFKNASIVRTMKGNSKRGKYYCVEDPKVMKYLNSIRSKSVVESHG